VVLEGPVRVELLEAVEAPCGSGVMVIRSTTSATGSPISPPKARGCSLSDGGSRSPSPAPTSERLAYLVDTDGFRVEPKPEDGKATIERWLAGGSLYD